MYEQNKLNDSFIENQLDIDKNIINQQDSAGIKQNTKNNKNSNTMTTNNILIDDYVYNDNNQSNNDEEIKINDIESQDYLNKRVTRADLATLAFYRHDHWFDELCEVLFKIKERKTSISLEIYYGFIHFISCLYVLAVVPQQLANAGYSKQLTVVAVSSCCGLGSVIGGLFTNLPFVIAPVTVVSIFLSVYLQSNNMNSEAGSAAVLLSGGLLMFLFYRPLGEFIVKLIPLPIQVGTSLGVALLTALAGAVEIDMVQQGDYSLLEFGPVTLEVVIAMIGLLVICTSLYYHLKGAFVIALVGCSLAWWISTSSWPTQIVTTPNTSHINNSGFRDENVPNLTINLVFLYILYLSGLIPAFSDLAELKREDGTTPRGRWFYIIAGVMTILSGVLLSAPILVSPESSAGIKAGAKTGLSTFVCGILFALSVFFAPIFEAVPSAGTSPLLLTIGIILFQNVSRVNWKNIEDAAPAFVTLFFIPFTYSILNGVVLGYLVYIIINLSTGDLYRHMIVMYKYYFPHTKYFKDIKSDNLIGDNADDGLHRTDRNSTHSIQSHRSSMSIQLYIPDFIGKFRSKSYQDDEQLRTPSNITFS